MKWGIHPFLRLHMFKTILTDGTTVDVAFGHVSFHDSDLPSYADSGT